MIKHRIGRGRRGNLYRIKYEKTKEATEKEHDRGVRTRGAKVISEVNYYADLSSPTGFLSTKTAMSNRRKTYDL